MNYILIRKKRNKKAYIRIKDGAIHVTAPFYMSKFEIDAFVEKNKEWIEAQIKKDEKTQSGEKIFLLGKSYIVQYHDLNSCIVKDNVLFISKDQSIIENFLFKNIKNYIDQRFNYFCEQIHVSDIKLKYRVYKSKWGSCTPSKKLICFNINLIFMPLDFIDAIILHELAHLYHLNHGKEFYRLLCGWMPSYKQVIKKGKEFKIPHLY